MQHRYFWGHSDQADQDWHIFEHYPDEYDYPDDGSQRFSLCGREWSYLAAIHQPTMSEPHCATCMAILHDRTLKGTA